MLLIAKEQAKNDMEMTKVSAFILQISSKHAALSS